MNYILQTGNENVHIKVDEQRVCFDCSSIDELLDLRYKNVSQALEEEYIPGRAMVEF